MIERGAYRDLLDSYYQSNGRLRSDTASLYRICGAVMPDEQAAVRQVVSEFFQDGEPGFLKNARADIELAEQASYFAAQAANGKKGAYARWHGDANGTAIAPPLAPPQSGQWPNDGHIHKQLHKQKKERARATRLSPDWEMPIDWKLWAESEKPEWSDTFLLKTASDFKDYWLAAPNGAKLDWLATWRKWVRNTNAPKDAPKKQDLGHYQ
jgi:uncharacterized protein YdaU (DUF1376 family)